MVLLLASLKAILMSTPSDRLIMEYTDASGAYLRASNWIAIGGSLAALVAAVQACSNTNITFATSNQPLVGTATPGLGLYPSLFDGALFSYQTGPGQAMQFFLPAPLGSLFSANGVQIDTANPLIIALNTAIAANLTDPAGNSPSALISAVKTSRRSDQVS
jgi:hypothetical protein